MSGVTLELCTKCAPLLLRPELDTMGKVRARLCPTCKTRLAYKVQLEKMRKSNAELTDYLGRNMGIVKRASDELGRELDELATFLRNGIAAQQAVDVELGKQAVCLSCESKIEGVVAEPDREYLCPSCFSSLSQDERRRGVVKKKGQKK